MSKVVLFGEIMLRLSPRGFNRFTQADTFDVNYGGSEANVAVSLSNFDVDAKFVTKLPNNEIGQSAFNKLRQFGVNISNIIFGGERLGIYYLENGASQRPSKVIYDRLNSSISKVNVEDFNWEEIFKDAKWFHFSGITPALSDNLSEICLIACKKAKENSKLNNITFSVDGIATANAQKGIFISDIAITNAEDTYDYSEIKNYYGTLFGSSCQKGIV